MRSFFFEITEKRKYYFTEENLPFKNQKYQKAKNLQAYDQKVQLTLTLLKKIYGKKSLAASMHLKKAHYAYNRVI